MPTFSDYVQPVTAETVRSAITSAAAAVGINIDALAPNNVIRTLARSIMPNGIRPVFEIVSVAIRGGFLDWAADDEPSWLDRLGEQVYDTPRIRQTFATTQCTFTNASGNLYAFTENQVRVAHTVTGKTYVASALDIDGEPFTLQPSPGPGNTATVTVIALGAGSDWNADVGDITTMDTVFEGVTVTNPTAATATDLEQAEPFRARCRLSMSRLSDAGPAQAYQYIAMSALREDGTAIGVTKVAVIEGFGTVQVLVADADGVPATPDVERIEDLILYGDASVNLFGAVPSGIDFQGVDPASLLTVDITYTGKARTAAGIALGDLEDLVEAALAALFESNDLNPIGGIDGGLYRSKIQATIEQVLIPPGVDGVVGAQPFIFVDVTTPASAQVSYTAFQVGILGTVTHNITFV